MDYAISVEGLSETIRALDAVNRQAKRTLLKGLREAATPIASETRSLLSRYNEISLQTIRPSAGVRGVSIIQRAPKVTGERPDFGALQMRKGFIPAAYQGIPLIVADVNAAFDLLLAKEGF